MDDLVSDFARLMGDLVGDFARLLNNAGDDILQALATAVSIAGEICDAGLFDLARHRRDIDTAGDEAGLLKESCTEKGDSGEKTEQEGAKKKAYELPSTDAGSAS